MTEAEGQRSVNISNFDTNGQVNSFQVTGNSYMGAVVNETFVIKNNVAQWSSAEEKGNSKVSSPIAYVDSNGTPESTAILISICYVTTQ